MQVSEGLTKRNVPYLAEKYLYDVKTLKNRLWEDAGIAFVCLLTVELIWFLIILTAGSEYSFVESFFKWDSFHYLEIAQNGYSLYPCAENPEIPAGFGKWCGNAGWMPLYPLLIKVLSFVITPRVAMVILSKFFLLCATILLFREEDFSFADKTIKGMLFCLFPGMLYACAAFPVSLTLMLLLITIRHAGGGSKPAAIAAVLLLPWSYASGFLVIPALLLAGLFRKQNRQIRHNYYFLAIVGSISWLLTFFFWEYSTGEWNAFFLVQEKYGYGIKWPIITWFDRVSRLIHGFDPCSLQTLMIPLIMFIALRSGFRHPRDSRFAIWIGLIVLFWIFPLCLGGALSLHRAESILSISLLFWRPSDRWSSSLLMGLFLTLYLALLWTFVKGELV